MKLYQIEVLIAQKAMSENKKHSVVAQELAEYLGIGRAALYKIRTKRVEDRAKITPKIFRMADFFNCQMDDLINPMAKKFIPQQVSR